MAGGDEKMNYLEALEYFLQEYIFENDKTDILFNQKFNAFEFPGTDFVSAFRVSGIPILPPLMTESRRREMRTYKRQAVLREVARQEKLNFGAVTEDTGTAKPDDLMTFHEPGQVEDDEREVLFRGMANENTRQNLVHMDYKDTDGSDFSSCCHKVNHPASDTKFIVNDDRNLADPLVEFSKHMMSPGKLQTSTEEPNKSKEFYLQNQFVKKDMIEFVTTGQPSINNVIYCDSQTFRDSGTHSIFSSAVDKSNSSSVTVVMNRFRQPVECIHPKSSVDSGLCSKDLTTITSDSAVNHDGSETLDEESYLTSSEDLDRSTNSMFEVRPSTVVKASSISSEKSLPIGDEIEPCSAVDTVPDEQNTLRDDLNSNGSPSDACNEKKPHGQLTMEEQTIFDEFMTSKDSVSSAFSGESNEMIRTVIDCQDCKVPSSSTRAKLCGKKMFNYASSNDSSCTECGEEINELNQDLGNNTAGNCLTSADNSVTEKLSQHLGQVCPGFVNGFNLHVEKDDETENEDNDEENDEKVEARDEEAGKEGSDVEENEEVAEEKETEEEEQEKQEGAEMRISDKLNSGEITHLDQAEEKLKESEDNLGNDLDLKQQLNPEKDLKQEKDDKHELGEEQPEEKELQQEVASVSLTDDKQQKRYLEITCESKLENNVKLNRMMEQGKEFIEDMKDNTAQQEQNAEEEKTKAAIEDAAGQRNDHVETNTDMNDEGLPSDKIQQNFGSLLERKPANDLQDKCEEAVSVKPLPSHISLEKKVAQVLCKLDKYHDTQTVCKESNPSSTSDPAVVLPTTVVCQADSSVSSGLPKDSHVMPNLLPTFSANTELAPFLVSLLTGDTIENCMTMILADHDSSQFPLGYFDQENIQNHESESGNEQGLPPARIRRNSYVISSPEVSQITENECPTSDGMRKLRRGSYTLENPLETLQSAEVSLDTNHNKFSCIKTTDVNDSLPSTEMPTKTKVNSRNSLLVGEAEQSSSAVAHPEKDSALNSEAVAMAAKRARIRSEQVGKLEHLRRYLQQVSDMGTMETPANGSIQQDEHDEMDYLSKGTAGNGVHPHLGQMAPTGVHVAHSRPRGVNSEVVSLGDRDLAGQSSCDLPVDVSEEVVQKEFELKISQIKEKHKRDLARLIAGQQLLLQREILLHEQQLGQRNFQNEKLLTVGSSKQSGSSSRNGVDYQRSNGNAHVMVAGDRSGNVTNAVNCAGDGIDRQCVDSHPLTCRPTVAFALDCGDSRMIQSTAAAPLYFEQRRMVSPALSLSTLQSEDNESEFAYKSPAVLRQAKSNHSSCSPKAPMYSSPASRHRTSFTEAPSSGGNAHSSLAEPADDNAKAPYDVWKKLERLPALVRGYLTRRLMKTERVQYIIQTIQDTAMFALHFQLESPMKKGFYSMQDRQLHERVLAQLTAAMYEIHEIFFEISIKERMTIISQSRALRKEKLFKESRSSVDKKKRMSAATLKAIERKRLTSIATARQTKPQNDVRPVRSQASPRNTGKENVHRILGKEKTRVVAANTTNKPKLQGCNVKISKKTPSVAPARKVARMANKQTDDHVAVKQLNCYNHDVAQATVKNAHDRKHLNLHQKETASSEALASNNRPKLSPNSNPNYWLNPQVGAVLYDSDSHSSPNSLNESQENFSRMMAAYQRHTVRSCAVQEKDTTRKIACARVQSRFS